MAFVRPVTRLRAGNSSVSGSVYAEHTGSGLLVPASSTLAGTGNVSGQGGGAAEPFFEDDFSSYTLGTGVAGHGANGFSWTSGNGDGVPTVVECPWDTDQRALRFRFDSSGAGDGHLWQEQRWNHGRDLQELWFEFDMYFPAGTEPDGDGGTLNRYEHAGSGSSQNNKWVSLWAISYQDEPLSIFQFWPLPGGNSSANLARTRGTENAGDLVHYYRDGVDSGSVVSFTAVGDNDRGRWVNFRFYHRQADVGVYNGDDKIWKDGTLVFSAPGNNNWDYNGTNNYIRRGYLLGYDNSLIPVLTYIYIRNFRIWDQDPGWED